jgi:RNA polymerase sigma factor (sigma-70 family)
MKSGIEPMAAAMDREPFDFSAVFLGQYQRIVRIISRIVEDPSRSEDLAVEVFWKLWRTPAAQGDSVNGWLYRTAVRMGLDELRRRHRREKYESLFSFFRTPPTPEQIQSNEEQQKRVRITLSRLKTRDAELLLLRSEGLSYQETAQALGINSASIGTLLRRAQETFRKEYVKHYGKE